MDEESRPPSGEVRMARKLILAGVKQHEPIAGLCKATQASGAYGFLVDVMEFSRIRSMQGLQDQAATDIMESTADEMEVKIPGAFDDLHAWANPWGLDPPAAFDLLERRTEVGHLKHIMVSIHNSVTKWSPSGLQEHLEATTDILGNVHSILSASSWTICAAGAFNLLGPLRPFEPAKAS